jgi:hypothetical protein
MAVKAPAFLRAALQLEGLVKTFDEPAFAALPADRRLETKVHVLALLGIIEAARDLPPPRRLRRAA